MSAAVVIPTYNCALHLRRALYSVAAQTYQDIDVVVVDDGSTDGTEAYSTYMPSDWLMIKQTHSGPAAARNRGIAASSSKYVAFLDADDIWLPEKLELQIELLERQPEVGLVCSYCSSIGSDGVGGGLVRAPSLQPGNQFEYLLRDCFIFTPTVVVRRECLEEVGGFNGNLKTSEDFNLWLKITTRWQIAIVPEVLAARYLRPDSISSITTPEESCRGNILALEDVRSSKLPLTRSEVIALRAALGSRHYTYGSMLFARRSMKDARHHLWKAWRYRSSNWRALLKLVCSVLPAPWLTSLLTLRSRRMKVA